MNPKELKSALREVSDGTRERRVAKANSWSDRLTTDIARLVAELAANGRHFREHLEAWTGRTSVGDEQPHINTDDRAKTRAITFGGLAAGLLEVIFAAFVSASLLACSKLWAAVVGIGVTILISGMVKSVYMRRYRPDEPRTSLHAIQRWAGIWFWISTAGLAALVLARSFEWAGGLVLAALAVMTLSLPAYCGAILVVAFIIDWRQRFANRREALERELNDTKRCAQVINALRERPVSLPLPNHVRPYGNATVAEGLRS